jgi:uncharacterized protein YcbK (DUF882 family)
MVKRTKGSSYEIIDRNGKISIAGRADISVNGACNIFVGNDANIEVEGDTNLTCYNDITAQAGGKFNLSAVEEFNIASGNVNIEAYYTMNQKAGDSLNISSDKIFNAYGTTGLNIESKAGTNVKSGAGLNIESSSSMNLKSGSSLNAQASSSLNIKASGAVNLDGSTFKYQSGAASGAGSATGAATAKSSKIGVLAGRKDISDNDKNDPLVLSLADSRSIALEEETQSLEDSNIQKNLIISEGFANAADLSEPPTAVDSATVQSEQQNFVEPDVKLKTVTQLPGNYNLSPNFTVEMLSSKAAVTRDPIRGHEKATYGEIIFNLQAIALNVLEPVKKIYPNMFVTSAFRDPGNASNAKTSQHPLGQGVDIQFKGITKKEYFEIATKLAKVLKYDQMILEYCSYAKNPWIHVSYSVKNRSQVLTFYNHKTHSQGLTQLA